MNKQLARVGKVLVWTSVVWVSGCLSVRKPPDRAAQMLRELTEEPVPELYISSNGIGTLVVRQSYPTLAYDILELEVNRISAKGTFPVVLGAIERNGVMKREVLFPKEALGVQRSNVNWRMKRKVVWSSGQVSESTFTLPVNWQ